MSPTAGCKSLSFDVRSISQNTSDTWQVKSTPVLSFCVRGKIEQKKIISIRSVTYPMQLAYVGLGSERVRGSESWAERCRSCDVACPALYVHTVSTELAYIMSRKRNHNAEKGTEV